MSTTFDKIAENLKRIRGEIEEACATSNRDPGEVKLVAVTKYAQDEWVQALIDMGVSELGESRPQQLVPRADQFDDKVTWHMIGHLQRNKVRPVLPIAQLIHSVDTLKLLSRVDLIAGDIGLKPSVLLEVNISGEESKHGFSKTELLEQWEEVVSQERVNIRGLMTMAPRTDSADEAISVFEELRELRDELSTKHPHGPTLAELSMGMSNDFPAAIKAGATIIRVGSRLYDGLC